MQFVEFLEAVARIADKLSPPSILDVYYFKIGTWYFLGREKFKIIVLQIRIIYFNNQREINRNIS